MSFGPGPNKIFDMGYVLIVFWLTVSLLGCSTVSNLKSTEEKSYTLAFLAKIDQVKGFYQKRHYQSALNELNKIQGAQYSPIERAYAKNLMGIVYFSMGDLNRSETSFLDALSLYNYRSFLRARIHLNLAGLYYKKNIYPKSYQYLVQLDEDLLEGKDREKFHELGRIIGKELGQKMLWTTSLIGIVGEANSIDEIKSHALFETLRTNYLELGDREKASIFTKGKEDALLLVGYLSFLDAKRRYYEGDRERAIDILDWLKGFYGRRSGIRSLIDDFFMRIDNYSKMNAFSIGIVLPLSGKRANFGKRALTGIDQGIRSHGLDKYKIHIVDSEGSGAVGSYRVKELAESHFVSTIIGGLFPQEALEEYLEAKKHGILYISLSQIYLPKDEKDHLLLEVPGSIESQMELLFSKKMLNKFGRKAAMVYPQDRRGEAYMDEFWRRAGSAGVDITGVQSYKKDEMDYRHPIEKLLGLYFERERQEERDILSKIYQLEKKRSVRRIQILRPQIDFDWVFIPAFPKEALQIIPSFSYYDAFGVKIIGESAWRSQSLLRQEYRYTNIYFVGDDIAELSEDFSQNFFDRYRRRPRILEIRGYDAFFIVSSLLKGARLDGRDKLDRHIRSRGKISGITGSWNFQDGTWLKEMAPYTLKKGKIDRL